MMDKRQELLQYISRLEAQLKALFGATYSDALRLADVRKAIEAGAQFTWKGNPAAERKLDQQLQLLAKKTDSLIKNGITGSWKVGESEVKDAILEKFGKTAEQKDAIDTIVEKAVKDQRTKGMNAHTFAARKQGGLSLSNRVWNLSNNAKKELEVIIQNGILEGKSADEVTQSLKGYLNEPDKLFKRVKNKETEEMEWSAAAKKYNPGQGVYRSSYKNAMRLARTEINAAYRRAEWESYQSNPLITAYRIELSNNHTTLVNGKPVPFHDICDDLVGIYPKTFLWLGWHPQCRCRMVPVMISDAEFAARMKALGKGKLKDWKPKNTVKQPPKVFFDWVDNNRERAKGWGNMPFFVRDNKKFVDDFKVNTYTEEERKFTQARKTTEAMQRAIKELSELYPNIENTELAALHHYTKQGGNYRQLNKQLDKGEITDFNKASASLMAKGLTSLPVFKGTAYRGTIMKRKDYERLYDGKSEIEHNIFTSASKDAGVAWKFTTYRDLKKTEVRILFEIQSKNGRDISKISEFNGNFTPDNQKEVLFTNGTRFRIVGSEKDLFGNIYLKIKDL